MNTLEQQPSRRRPYKLLFFCLLAISIMGAIFSLQSLRADPTSPVRVSTDPERIKISEGIFTLTVMVNSNIPVNTFAVDLHFDPTLVAVETINYESSIANLWVYTPTFNNASGTISAVSGTTEAGGFTGSGTLFTITFKTRTSGTTAIGLTKASVLQSDGFGTPADLAEMNDTIVTIVPQTIVNNMSARETDPIHFTKMELYPVSSEFDLNNDGLLTFSDAGVLMQFFGTTNAKADLDHDGLVTNADLEILLTQLKMYTTH